MSIPRLTLVILGVIFASLLSADAEIFVPNSSGGSISVFADSADGDTAPLRTISGSATGLGTVFGLAVDLARLEIFVAQGRLLVFESTENVSRLVEIDVDPASDRPTSAITPLDLPVVGGQSRVSPDGGVLVLATEGAELWPLGASHREGFVPLDRSEPRRGRTEVEWDESRGVGRWTSSTLERDCPEKTSRRAATIRQSFTRLYSVRS